MKGEFFSIGKGQFLNACELGMNPAIALLILARGTGADNVTTSWSALAVFNHSGMARRRAREAIDSLIDSAMLKLVKGGTKPRYKLNKPKNKDLLLWLPNALIDGVGKEVPPITKLRESCSVELLEKFIELYDEQDLETDGGIPRSIARVEYDRTRICSVGPFILYGFHERATLAAAGGILAEYFGVEDEYGNLGAWTILKPLIDMGLIQCVTYIAESAEMESELIYPVNAETNDALESLIYWLEESGGVGYAFKAREFEYHGIAMEHIKQATMVGLLRMTYRPKTSKTSRWWARDRQAVGAMTGLIEHICFREKRRKCAHQG
jgi:hypothetical protein